jgi:hypothetical protein
MSVFSWLRNRTQHLSPRPRPAFRPRLEALEGRIVPSTLTVLNNLDSGAGSLRAEIAAAKKGDSIVFAPSLNGQTITLTSGELDITTSLSIQGPGASQLTISGSGLSRVFEVASKVTVTLSGLTVSNGNGVGSPSGNQHKDVFTGGGGILNLGTLTVSSCDISYNTTTTSGGGIANHGTLIVNGGSVLSYDTAQVPGTGNGVGGGIANFGTATVTDSTVSNDSAGYEGGGVFNVSTMTVSGCTLSYDFASYGGGIYNGGLLTISNSIFSHNLPGNIYGSYTDGGGNSFN